MSKILDHTQDLSGQETHRLTSLYPAPAFVKEAAQDRLYGDPELLPAHVYGDPVRRLYPCHAAPAVWLSTAFFMDKRAELDAATAARIEATLDKAAAFFNIKPICDQLKAKMATDQTHDLNRVPDDDFALVWEADGQKQRNYPLRNAAEVKMASQWFCHYRDEFAWVDRSTIARKICEKAAQYETPLDHSEILEKTAGYGYCANADIVEMLVCRANMVARSHPDCSQEMRKLAQIVQASPLGLHDSLQRDKVAAVVDQFDRFTKLTRLYDDGGLERPEEVLYKLTEKAAADFVQQHVQMTSGTVYEKSALDELGLEHVKSWMGEDFAAAVSAGGMYVDAEKIGAVAATLPRSDAELFDRMAAEAGVRALVREKAAQTSGPDLAQLHALAGACGAGDKQYVL